ncbi:hypothetical protein D3C86_1743340 [compost metagenome]
MAHLEQLVGQIAKRYGFFGRILYVGNSGKCKVFYRFFCKSSFRIDIAKAGSSNSVVFRRKLKIIDPIAEGKFGTFPILLLHSFQAFCSPIFVGIGVDQGQCFFKIKIPVLHIIDVVALVFVIVCQIVVGAGFY